MSDTQEKTLAATIVPDDGSAALTKKLIRQVEFYFSDFNLHKDKFMQEHMKKDDGWFTMDVMLNFQRLSNMCSEPGTILAALKGSKNDLIEVDVDNLRIRRNPKRPLPVNDAQFVRDLKLRTVFVSGFPQTEKIEELQDFLEEYGIVDGIKLQRFEDKNKGSLHKGELFVSFSKFEEAERFLQAPMVHYKDKALEKKSKTDFYAEKNKKSNGNDKPKPTQKEEDEDKVVFLHVDGVSDQLIGHQDLKALFEEIGAPSFKFFYRYEKGGPDAYIVMSTQDDADQALKVLGEKKGEGISLKDADNITIVVMPEDKLALAQESYSGMRAKFLTKKGAKGGRFGKNRNGHGQKRRNNHKHFNDNGGKRSKAE